MADERRYHLRVAIQKPNSKVWQILGRHFATKHEMIRTMEHIRTKYPKTRIVSAAPTSPLPSPPQPRRAA